MRCVVVGLFGLFSSLAHADAYDVDTVCGVKPQEQPLKTLCTELLLSSARQLERAYWTALASAATPNSYQDLEKDLSNWRHTYTVCGTLPHDQETSRCLTQAMIKFGSALEPKIPESMEDIVETDELFESAKQTLASFDQQMADRLETCRKNAEEKLDDGNASPGKTARSVWKACSSPAQDYVHLLLSEHEGSALYLLKVSGITLAALRAETEKRYGPEATEPFVLERRAERKLGK